MKTNKYIKDKELILSSDGRQRFNTAAWQTTGGSIYTLFREIVRRGKTNQPDFSRLVLAKLDKEYEVIRERVVWEPKKDSIFLEDARSMKLPGNRVVIGLTALLRDNKGKYIPYPSLTHLATDEWDEELPAVTIIETFGPGKNTTPLEPDIFAYRPDGSEYTHKLLLFSLYDMLPNKIQDMSFPKDISWASLRIGTTTPPIWLSHNKALFIFHGIKKNEKYVYSLGVGGLEKENGKYNLRVSRKRITHPDDFLNKKGKPLIKELHPKKSRVVYSCGGIVNQKTDRLILLVNVGDTSIFRVVYSLSQLEKEVF